MGKKKKEKIYYVDDGRTIADMSGISSGPRLSGNPYRPAPRFKDVWNTYWNAVKMMIPPMLTVIVVLGVIYMVMYLVFFLMY